METYFGKALKDLSNFIYEIQELKNTNAFSQALSCKSKPGDSRDIL